MITIKTGIFFCFLLKAVFLFWLQNCQLDDSYQKLIQTSLEPFQNGISAQLLEKTKNSGFWTCTAQIQNHKFVENSCLDHLHQCYLDSIAQYLPDMEFVINKDDRPLIYKNDCPSGTKGKEWVQCACDKNYTRPPHGIFQIGVSRPSQKLPIFSSCTISHCFLDIIFPSTYHLDIAQRMRRPKPWEQKIFKAFWRGSSTGAHCISTTEICRSFHRQRLVGLCSRVEDCDAQFSKFVQCDPPLCDDMNKTYGLAKKFITLKDQSKFKVLIDIDGNSYSGRFPSLLSTGSAVMKIHMVKDVATEVTTPWEHYVPVNMDLSDFEEKLKWAKQNDDQLRDIAKRGLQRYRTTMNYKSLQCFGIHLLKAYHKLIIVPQSPGLIQKI